MFCNGLNFYERILGGNKHLAVMNGKSLSLLSSKKKIENRVRFYSMKMAGISACYNRRDAIVYALSIGCMDRRYVYENEESFMGFPTIALALTLKGNTQDVQVFPPPCFPVEQIPLNGPVLDGERLLEIMRPLNDHEDLTMHSIYIGNFKSGSGTVAQTETVLREELSGRDVARITSNTYYIGTTDYPDRGVCRKLVKSVPLDRDPDHSCEYQTFSWQAALYRLNGDYNPLHIDPGVAQAFGFREPILHGLCTLGISVRLVVDYFSGGDASRVMRVGCRFSKPVFPGDLLRVEMWKMNERSVSFRTREFSTNRIVIDLAFVDFFPSPEARL